MPPGSCAVVALTYQRKAQGLKRESIAEHCVIVINFRPLKDGGFSKLCLRLDLKGADVTNNAFD